MTPSERNAAADPGPGIDTVRTVDDLRARVSAWRRAGETVGLVPTMGALHEGHLSLIRRARALADRTCVTLFVNPTQFGPNEDFDVYPRDETGDIAKMVAEGAHLLFAPSRTEMYPDGEVTRVSVPGLGDMLEGAFRPGFFTGVATVVAKLLIQALPDVAVFGEKDYQQLQVIKRMTRDLSLPVRIHGEPTVREPDGLALSSRNAYLSAEERRIAPALHRTIGTVATHVAGGANPTQQSRWGTDILERCGFAKVDYLEVRDAETLAPWPGPTRPGRVLAAARLGRTRLIDNVPVG
jgi:pantoate--beta-alanine ligase